MSVTCCSRSKLLRAASLFTRVHLLRNRHLHKAAAVLRAQRHPKRWITLVQVSFQFIVHLLCQLGVKAFARRNNINLSTITGTGKGGRVTKEDVVNALSSQGQKVRSTPAVRAFAKENNVNINLVSGTGPNGRVTRDDILAFMNGTATQTVLSTGATTKGVIGVPQQPPLSGITGQDHVKKITGMKKAMTKTMTQALSIPTFTYSDDIDATDLMRLRTELKEHIPGLTMLPFFIKALSLAMKDYPIVNSVVNPELDAEGYIQEYVIKHDHNFSVAIDSDHGLTTPNLKQLQNKSILQINQDLRVLIDKVKNNQLTQQDFDDASFSVSSVGNIGGKYFVPTILRPQAAIIAIGKASRVPKYFGDDLRPIDQISFSITADHRILDGATVARFCQRMKQYVENPNLMLISM